MGIFDIGELGTFGLEEFGGDWAPAFNLGGPTSMTMGSNFNLPNESWYNWQAPNIPQPGGGDWWSQLSNFATQAAPIWQIGQEIGGTALKFLDAKQKADFQDAMEDYTKRMGDYWTNRQASEAAYNAEVMKYLQAKAEWEAGMAGTLTEGIGGFQEKTAAFQEQLQGIIEQTLGESQNFFAQSQELLEPAIAALAKGEVPPVLEPVLEQLKQRARAAALSTYASAGMEESTAAAAIYPTVDAMATEQLIKFATAMLGGGVDIAKLGAQGKATAMQGAGMGVDAATREMALLMQAMNSLYGSFPSMAGGSGGGPPAPVAPPA